MKKLISLLCVGALLFATTAFAFDFQKEKLTAGIEYNGFAILFSSTLILR